MYVSFCVLFWQPLEFDEQGMRLCILVASLVDALEFAKQALLNAFGLVWSSTVAGIHSSTESIESFFGEFGSTNAVSLSSETIAKFKTGSRRSKSNRLIHGHEMIEFWQMLF